MKETILTLVATILIGFGLLFFLGAAVGLFRFPDFYARMHAAGKGDTLSSFLVILGFAVYQLNDLSWPTVVVIVKLLAICGFIMLTSPTSTHALMDAGWEDGIDPELKNECANDLATDMERKKS